MVNKNKAVDVVIVGFGWTGAIMGKELTDIGLNVLALERGDYRDTYPDFAYPRIADELTYGIRLKLFQDMSKSTVTIRHNLRQQAVPYRQMGSFLPGNGVGGAGVHWNGQHWRALPDDLQLRSKIIDRYGQSFIPDDMTLADYGVTYEELEPFFNHFEAVCGTSGQAGNLNGEIITNGNPFEGMRQSNYPTPPLTPLYQEQLFAKASRDLGFHPFKMPASNTSQAYLNPYGVQMGPCNFCGYCERFGCFLYSKASPQSTILPVLLQRPNFTLMTNSHVTKVNLDSHGEIATGVTYINAQGLEIEQSATMVILSAFQLHNVKLMLMSGIGKPYDPISGTGVIGKNYAYQILNSVDLFYDEDHYFNPYIGAGAAGTTIDDFNGDNFDHSELGFIGGATISAICTGGRPIQQMPLPIDTPSWGGQWKAAIKKHYLHTMTLSSSGSVMPYRQCYLDLDPTYRDAYGQPLLRMTFDWQDNELMMSTYVTKQMVEIAEKMQPLTYSVSVKRFGSHYDVRPYQSTHNTGGAIMGMDPTQSALNKYLQSWNVHNVFVMGASAFPQNMAYNPTGLVGALAYWSAHAIKTQYLSNPRPLVDK